MFNKKCICWQKEFYILVLYLDVIAICSENRMGHITHCVPKCSFI